MPLSFSCKAKCLLTKPLEFSGKKNLISSKHFKKRQKDERSYFSCFQKVLYKNLNWFQGKKKFFLQGQVCKRKQEKTREVPYNSDCVLSVCLLFTVPKPPDKDVKGFGVVLIPWEQRILSSQRKGSVIIISAVIRVLICSETAQHQHMGVLLLSPGWRLGEFIFLWEYLLYFFLQTIKSWQTGEILSERVGLVGFFWFFLFRFVGFLNIKYLREALIFIYQEKRFF